MTFSLHFRPRRALMRRGHLAVLLLLLWPAPAVADRNFPFDGLDTLGRRTNLVYNPAVKAQWLGRSTWFWYRNHEREGTFFYLVDASTGTRHRAARREDLATHLSHEPELAEQLRTGREPQREPRREKRDESLSADGRWRAYVRDGNVFITRADSPAVGRPVQLSYDGAPGYGYEQLRWSPDSRRLAALKVRQVQVRRIPLLESAPADQLQPKLHWLDYAKPGDALPVSLPALFDVEQQRQIPLDTRGLEPQFSLQFTGWREDSRAYTFEFNQRGHQRYVVGEVKADGTVRPLIDEQASTFIDYTHNYRYDLADGKEILWLSDRSGWRHLYLIDGMKGRVKNAVTKGEWVVRRVLHVDEEHRQVYFMASGLYADEDPYNLHYCRVNLDGSGFTDLTPERANHELSFSADRSRFVDVYSRPDMPPVSVVRNGQTGQVITELQRCDITDLLATGWIMPEVFHTKGRDGKTDIWGTIFRPARMDSTRSYPVVEDIYAGPHDSFVNKNFSAFDYYISPLAELGFIVVKIDGMGTNNRSKAFHDVCWKNLRDAGYPDRILWIKDAARHHTYMDTTRVGVYGWSAGGQNAMAALLFFNDFYKAAVSFCGCHDNRMDKIWWNEQWMGYPVDSAYSRSSNVDNAYRLKGDLMLINGELDNNVDPASTLQVVNALMKANKRFEQFYLPGRTHSLGDRFEVYRMYDFFVRKLRDRKP